MHSCLDFKLSGLNAKELKETGEDIKKWNSMKKSPKSMLVACNSMVCGLPGCAIVIAGLIKYLKDSGRENEIIEQRKYYHENEEECNEKYKELFSSQNTISDKIDEYISKLRTYNSPNLGNLISILEKAKLSNLLITIEGKDKTEKKLVIENIYQVLLN